MRRRGGVSGAAGWGALGPARIAILTLFWVSPALGAAQVPLRAADPLQTIERWTLEYRRQGPKLDVARDAALGPALQELRGRFNGIDMAENEALVALCDLASIAPVGSDPWVSRGSYVADSRERQVRHAAQEVLRAALDAPYGVGRGQWLAENVLAGGRDHPLARRIAVAEALDGRHWDPTMVPLLASAAAPERGLREAAVTALSGWKSPAVDRYLAGLTVRSLEEPGFLSTAALLEHFEAASLPADSPAAAAVAQAVCKATISPDWREAVRRIPLSRALSNDRAIPPLIEALDLWRSRGAAGGSSRRVEAALVHELELRSGKRLGPMPERWTSWWKSTRGKAPGTGASVTARSETGEETRAAFFGLRPWTDRVVFVIDRSGSMDEEFGTSGKSRYVEAIRQLSLLLEQLGPRTHFDLVLFSDRPQRWSGNLRPATPSLIDSAVQWARRNPPQGGTYLRPAIAEALSLDPRTGQPDLEELQADTVIVLCDGATAEGSSWVGPLIDAVGEATCVRFDCVQIGNQGNGTLESLAEETGGQFLRVDS